MKKQIKKKTVKKRAVNKKVTAQKVEKPVKHWLTFDTVMRTIFILLAVLLIVGVVRSGISLNKSGETYATKVAMRDLAESKMHEMGNKGCYNYDEPYYMFGESLSYKEIKKMKNPTDAFIPFLEQINAIECMVTDFQCTEEIEELEDNTINVRMTCTQVLVPYDEYKGEHTIDADELMGDCEWSEYNIESAIPSNCITSGNDTICIGETPDLIEHEYGEFIYIAGNIQ